MEINATKAKQAGLTQKSTSWPAGFSINNI